VAIARFDVGYVPGPVAAVSGIRHNATMKRGPSTLSGTVEPTANAARVLVKLTRGSGASCRAYNLARQAFTGTSCATNKGFAAVYADGEWTAYLGAALPKGAYVLEAVAVDRAGKQQPVTAGANQIRFTVAS